MHNTNVVNKLWGFCHTLRHDGIDYGDYIEQLTYLLFLKMAEERAAAVRNDDLAGERFGEGCASGAFVVIGDAEGGVESGNFAASQAGGATALFHRLIQSSPRPPLTKPTIPATIRIAIERATTGAVSISAAMTRWPLSL